MAKKTLLTLNLVETVIYIGVPWIVGVVVLLSALIRGLSS